MSSFCKCKSYSHFFSKNISVYAIFNDQSFNDTLTNNIASFEQLGPDQQGIYYLYIKGDWCTEKQMTKMTVKLASEPIHIKMSTQCY